MPCFRPDFRPFLVAASFARVAGSASAHCGSPGCRWFGAQVIDTTRSEFVKRKPKPVASIVLGIMVGMATLGLVFMWNTTSVRRSRDHLTDQTDPETLHTIVLAPSALPALGYLPSDVNAILGLHAAECTEQEDGRRFLNALRSLSVGGAGPRLDASYRSALGSHRPCCAGTPGRRPIDPRFTLVVRSRQHFDKNALTKALNAERSDRGKRCLFRFQPQGITLDLNLWMPDDRTLVISRAPEDFDLVPMTANPGIERFNADLQEVFRESLPTGIMVWLAAATRHGEQVLAPLTLSGMLAQRDLESFAPLQRLGVWLRAESKLEAAADADLRDEPAATRLKDYLAHLGVAPGQIPAGLEANAQTERLASQLKKSLTVEQKDSHLFLRASCSMDAFLEAVAR